MIFQKLLLMRRFCLVILLFLINVSLFAQKIAPSLRDEMNRVNDKDKINVFVIMQSQYDKTALARDAVSFANREARREYVVNELKGHAEASQYDLRKSLDKMMSHGLTTEPTVLWMSNALYFSATKDAIVELAKRKDIAAIGWNKEQYMLFDDDETLPADNTMEMTYNIIQVRADEAWGAGYTGAGVIVAVIDTGVNYNHLDLADHLWDDGTENHYHGWDFVNNDGDPMDDKGHGTHCAGTICGDGSAGTQTGMAPDATLMILKCLDHTGNGSIAVCMQAMEWAVDHGCDVISMSLGGNVDDPNTMEMCRSTCEAVLSAGVVAAIAAGNEGDMLDEIPIPYNVGVPGACPPPYLDPAQALNPGGLSCSVCIGAVDANDEPADFTSVGPVKWDNTSYADYPYMPGSVVDFGLIRPDVCAPGVQIKSADYQKNDGYCLKSGTSMATPCVAGCMALIMQKNPNITPAEMCKLLEETSVPLSETKSNYTGVGRIDVMEALNSLPFGSLVFNDCTVADEANGNGDHQLNPGETVSLNINLTNESNNQMSGATMVLSTESTHVIITDATVTLPDFDANQSQTVLNAFGFSVDNDVMSGSVLVFNGEVRLGGETVGNMMFSVPVYDYNLGYKNIVILNDANDNGSLDPGETAKMRIFIENGGSVTASSVTGVLSTDCSYLTLNETSKSYGDIATRTSAYADYSVTLSATAPQDYDIDFTLALTDAHDKVTNLAFDYCRYVINAIMNMPVAGTIQGAGYYNGGDTCTLVAAPNEGYLFENWTYGGKIVSTNMSLSFIVDKNQRLVANFIAVNGVYIGDKSEDYATTLPGSSGGAYNYSLSEQIYTAAEIGRSGYINSIAFYNDGYDQDAVYNIYMKHTTKDKFATGYDYETVSASDLVYSGMFTFMRGYWHVIMLDTPFAYDGTSNLLVLVDDNTGESLPVFGRVFYVEGDDRQAIYLQSDIDMDPLEISGLGIREEVKNQIILDVVGADDTFTVSVGKNDDAGGTVSGGGSYDYNTTCTVLATPATNYTFLYWTENGEMVSTEMSYTFDVRGNRNLTACFYSTDPIVFVDDNVKAICVENWDTDDDGELSYAEAAMVTDISNKFYIELSITSFDELQYFNSLQEIPYAAFMSCFYLSSITLPSTITTIGDCAFYGCFGLTSINMLPEEPPTLGNNAFEGVPNDIPVNVPCGTVEAYKAAPGWDYFTNIGINADPLCNYKHEYFTITSWEPDNIISFTHGNVPVTLYISYDKTNWSVFSDQNNTTSQVELGIGEKAYFKATTNQYGINDNGVRCNFSATKLFEASGNIMSLFKGDDFVDATQFCNTNNQYSYNLIDFFREATTLLSLENLILPATQYNQWVYQAFASGCTSLIKAPKELPAQTYQNRNTLVWMFENCTKLQESPVIRLTSNGSGDGWYGMFKNCSSLKRVICLMEGTNLTVTGDVGWLSNAPSGGVFYKKSTSTWQSGYNAIPSSWTTRDWREDPSDFVKVTSTPAYKYSCYVEGTSDYYQQGDTVTLKCTPINGYAFVGWYVNDALVSSDETYSFIAAEDIEVTPHLEESVMSQTTAMNAGWNWWSTYIEQENTDGLSALEASLGHNGLLIKSSSAFTQNYYNPPTVNDDYWSGGLEDITNEDGFMIQTNAACNIAVAGAQADPSEHPITIKPNWNWIGYPVGQEQTLAASLGSFEPADGDVIKNHSDFTVFYEGFGWYPADMNMTPGKGYLYKSNADANKTLTYVVTREKPVETAKHELQWKPEVHKYADNISVIAAVILDNEEVGDEIEVGAFVNGECRGSAILRYFEPTGRYYAMLSVVGENGDDICFEIPNAISKSHLIFHANDVVGSLDNPMLIECTTETTFVSTMPIYPNPVEHGHSFNIVLPKWEKASELQITNALGEIVRNESVVGTNVAGLRKSGVYMIKIICESGSVYYNRLIVK